MSTTATPAAPVAEPVGPPHDIDIDAGVTDIPAGTAMSQILRQLGISVRTIAKELNMSTTAMFAVVTDGTWPRRMADDAISKTAARLFDRLLNTRRVKRDVLLLAVRALLPSGVEISDVPTARISYGTSSMPLRDVTRVRLPKPTPSNLQTDLDPITEEPPMLMAKQTLTPAARRAFGMFQNPFDGEVQDEDSMFTNGEIAYVREACLQAALGGRFVALVSESGGGKTTMLQDLEARLQADRRPVIVIKPWVLGMEDSDTRGKTLKSADILHAIITTLDPLAQPRQTLQARSDQARLLLAKSMEAGYTHMLAIEEAHSLPEATLKHLKRLHEMRLGRRPLLGILLLGQTELGLRLDPRRASLREVTQRCEVVNLLPLDGDLQAYLRHRARAAGHDLDKFIDDSGINEIRARLTISRPGKSAAVSLTYPLAVNNLMTAALNLAAELGAPVITRDVVRGV